MFIAESFLCFTSGGKIPLAFCLGNQGNTNLQAGKQKYVIPATPYGQWFMGGREFFITQLTTEKIHSPPDAKV